MKQFTKGLKKAFTITELVIVIAVIAILAAVLIPTFSNVISSAKESAAMQECRNAYTDLSAKLEQSNQSSSGLVLTNDGYVFVALNGKLNKIDDLNSLASIQHSSTKLAVRKELPTTPDIKDGAAGTLPTVVGFDSTTFDSYTKDNGIVITVKQAQEKNAPKVQPSNIQIALEDNEMVFVYTLKLNDNWVVGYFVMETGDGAKKNVENNGSVVFSKAYGYVVQTADADAQGSITFAAGTEAVSKS